jgi:hypothetical protein
MIIWFSLVAAFLLFGGQSDAAPNHQRDMSPQTTQAPPTTSTDAPATTATPVGTFFQTNWDPIGGITLGQNAGFNYSVPSTLDEAAPNLVLCQTNATGANPLTSANTWSVVQITGN